MDDHQQMDSEDFVASAEIMRDPSFLAILYDEAMGVHAIYKTGTILLYAEGRLVGAVASEAEIDEFAHKVLQHPTDVSLLIHRVRTPQPVKHIHRGPRLAKNEDNRE